MLECPCHPVASSKVDSLLIDIGNTRVKWAEVRAGALVSGAAFPVHSVLSDSLCASQWSHLDCPGQVWISSVAAIEVTATIEAWLLRHWHCPVHHAGSESHAFGVTNAYEYPSRLGVDRWLSLIAVRQLYSKPLCVVGCGTALTLDAMDAEGRHQGGLIGPGLRLMHNSLACGTVGLSNILSATDFADALATTPADWAVTTANGMVTGCLEAGLGLIERAYARFAAQYKGACRLVLTGGDSELMARYLSVPCQVHADLVLKGLLRYSEA
ncbi:MAG: type III pantothenate kinase [Methylococcaceae bacterium]